MASVNKVILVGNCGRDPEMRHLPDGTAACSISVATTSRRKDRNTGESIEETQWHRVNFFDRLAEIVGEYVKKGSPVYVEGRLKYRKYIDKDGIEKNTSEIVAHEMQLLGARPGEGAPQRAAAPAPASRPSQAPRPSSHAPRPARQAVQPGSPSFDDMDGDIPF